MKQTVDFNGFVDAFYKHGRQTQFSHAALRVLYDYLEEMDEGYVLDVVALCCKYTEEDTAHLAERLDAGFEGASDDELLNGVLGELNNLTIIVGVVDGGARIIYLGY